MAVKRRIRTIELDGLSFKISPMTMDDVETYLAEGKKLVDADPKTDDAAWAKRTLRTVAAALNSQENDGKWEEKRVASELDMPTVRFVYAEYMKVSGLVAPEPGEARATSTSS
jgi:hypothetical protein